MSSIHDSQGLLALLPQNGLGPRLLREIERAVYKRGSCDPGAWDFLEAGLRDSLRAQLRPHELSLAAQHDAADGETSRYLFSAADGAAVESVAMRHPSGRTTLCLSSQAGCPMACRFCATGGLGLGRDLSAWEIVDQVEQLRARSPAGSPPLRNLVFMGMGEPFLNYTNLSQAIGILTDRRKYQFSHRRVTVSTCGLPEGIDRFGRDHPLASLAVSLHAPDDETRHWLMPGLRNVPLPALMASLDRYVERTGRKVFYEYLMLDGVSDRDAQAEALVELLADRLAQVNFIPWNPVEQAAGETAFRPSPPERLAHFRARLKAAGIPCTVRVSMGDDIAAACGQLASRSVPGSPRAGPA